MADLTSPLRRSQAIAPYSDAEQSLLDNAFASPFTRSLQQAINTDVAGTYRQQALEAQVRGDDAAQRAAEYNRQSSLRRMDLPTVGPTTWDAAKETGNYGDYVQNVLGGMAGSMVKPLVGSPIGGLVGGLPGAAVGGFGGSFSAIRNAELENYANDEQLKTLSPAEQLRVTRNSAALQALPEAVMPAYLGAGGRLPGVLNRAPTALRVAGSVATEGGTEGLQDYISQRVAQSQFPDREIDWNSVRENAIAGLVGGGAMGVLGRHDVDGGAPTPAARPATGEVSPMDAVPPTDGGGGGVSGLFNSLGERFGSARDTAQDRYGDDFAAVGEKAKGLAGAVKDRFGDDFESAGEKAKDFAGRATRKAKDIVSDTLDRMTEAVNTSANPGEFLNKVFGSNIDEEAAADLSSQPNPMLKGATFEETEANIARDDAQRVARAARYADELLNDPATPDSIKQRVAEMGGDYANPDNQAFVARTLVAQRGGEKVAKAVQDLVDLGKSAFAKGSEAASEGLSAAKKAVGDAATAAQDRIVKKNLQSASPAEQAAFGKVIFDGLTDEAKANPLVRAQLAQVTNAIMAFAAKTGDITAKDLPTLTKLSNAMSLFKDPDAMAQQLVEYGAIPRDADSFLGRIKRIQNAQTDVKQPNSFLVASLTPEAKRVLTAPMLKRVAQLVDEFSLRDAAGEGDRIVEGLAQAFGSKENAQAVLDYYAQQNKANVRFDPNEEVRDAGGEIDDDELSSWEGSINERDEGKAVFRFKDAKSMRPFFKGSKDIDNARRDGALGDESTQTPYSYAEYVKETGKDPEAELNRLLKDIDSRIAQHEARKGEDRSTLINALKGERSMLEATYKKGGAEEALSLYEVLRTEAKDQNDLVATDEDLAKYSFKKGASRVTFKRTDGTKLMLSAESMWKTFGDKTKGETSGGKESDTARARRLFNEAVASVLARPDIESLETSLSGLKIDSKGTEAEPKIDPVLREQIAHELNKASGSLSEIKAGLQRLFKGYSAALSQGNLGKQAVYTFEDQLRTRVDQASKAVEAATTAPQRAVLRERHMLYERALERVLEMKQNFLDDGVGGNNNTDELDPPVFSRLRKEMDTSNNERRVEEDTGAPVGTGGAPATGTGGGKKNPAASSRETAKKVDDTRAVSPDGFTALYDVVVKENYSRLDTPVKVLKFAALAAKAREQLKKIPELERTDEQDDLRFKLNDMFDQSKDYAFDWESLWDGLDPTDAQKAQLEDLIRPKAEPGTARQSTMKPKRGRPGKIDQQAILDEIARIRGKDVKVAFAKFADIGASGEFSMNKDKTKRLIKIAVNSLNPMSVAWHESLHDFMAMLGGSQAERKLKADLLDAAEAPQVMAKLRELLKDHPDALKQIETDREERLAYMYQFWAEGALPLGPTGTGIFSRMVTFFREMLGVLSQDQKIDQLFTALHTGKFAEPSLVGAVLEDLKAKTLSDKLRAVSGPIGDAAEAMFTGATDRLRNTNVEALVELADMFHREPGRENPGELPFLQRRAQQVGKRLNKLQDILKDTTSEERRRALENMQAMKPASTPLEKELAAYLKEMRDYMVDRGVKRFDTKTKKWTDLGNVKDYFPRVWDKEVIRNNEAEFINLMEQYIGKAQARETFNALVNGDGSLELAENEHTLGFTPWNPSVLDRQFTFINPSNAAAFAKFQSKDMADIMTSYTQRAVHRAEYAHTFGNDGEVITSKFLEAQKQGATQDELAMARKATMAMEGTLGYDFNPRLKEVMSGIVTYQNIVLLPLSLFSNLIDPLGVAMRSNDMKEAWKAFTYGMKGIADQLRGAGDDAQTEMAKTLGIIDEQNMLEAMGHVYNSMHMSSFLKNINSKFFRYNGMEMWNQRMRVAAMMAAQRFILSHAENVAAQISHGENKNDSSSYKNHSQRYLEELGIAESDVFQLQDGTIALTKDQLLQAGAKKSEVLDIEKRIQAAVFKWVDGAVLRPNAAHRPVWGSDPRYQLIFHLKQFTFSFHNTILRRVGEELKHGNVAPGWILMSYVPFMFLSDVLKGSLTGTLNTTADLYDVASQSIARSGIMGTGVFGADAMGDLERGKLPGTSFLGPAFGHLMTLLSGITGHAGVDQVMDRSVPFAKYI